MVQVGNETHINLLWLNETAIVGDDDHCVTIDRCPHTVFEAGVEQIEHEIPLAECLDDLEYCG